MFQARVIPCLLLKRGGLVKTVRFAKPSYVGDPINAVRIFNEKEVDELVLLDITASREKRGPDYDRIGGIIDEAFMPVGYGGGITTSDEVRQLVSLGVEKVIINTAALHGLIVVSAAAQSLGSQAVVVSINVRRDWRGRYKVYDATSGRDAAVSLEEHLSSAVRAGAGEIFINDVNRDGTGTGYDLELIRRIATTVEVPVIVCGGAGSLGDVKAAVAAGASAAAAGSMFVYMGRHRAVMINYPEPRVLRTLFADV